MLNVVLILQTDRCVPTSQVMGVQAKETNRDKATPTFYIKPVSMEGIGIKGAERLEDKGRLAGKWF